MLPDQQHLAQDRATTNRCLHELFMKLTAQPEAANGSGGQRFSSHPFVAAATARLIGACAQWFAQAEGAPLEGALNLLLQMLSNLEVGGLPSSCMLNQTMHLSRVVGEC